ncbi:TRAP transporter small permease [Elioraea sp. Yellowstone]|jgi:TRAP-type C4-dicarboxylate transport system permease small subunit|uniref:TRAP transporter small permease n=1 Tax=Elioraea sp. Yellowstone TaxID=2592070 RepID=UPI00115422DE|nr:TRAP transporter small permease [Elioraea sp. Yellowstone]TQF84478.1 TRAP transporter small permease [Elioraea sp. Yellowstone]
MLSLLGRFHAALRAAVGACFTVLLAAVLLQVVSRLALPNPPVWTEELSRFCLIFAAALGGGLALRSGELVGVDVVTAALPPPLRRAVDAIGCLAIIGFCALLLAPAWEFVDIGSLQSSPALGWNMFWVHMAMLIAPATLALAAFERLVGLFTPQARRG